MNTECTDLTLESQRCGVFWTSNTESWFN